MKNQKLIYLLFIVLANIIISACSQEKTPVDVDGRPLIIKRGTIDADIVESTPLVFNNKVYRFEYIRTNYWNNNTGNSYFRFIDREDGESTNPFAVGYQFGSAFVFNDSIYVTGTRGSVNNEIRLFVSGDMKNWKSRLVFELPDYELFNTSLTRGANDKFVLMYEAGKPKNIVGERFTAFFATSSDLINWNILSTDRNYAKDRYTAPHCLRFFEGYYYNFYLEAYEGYELRVVRSKDLIHWESSPLNPVMKASNEDKQIVNDNLSAELRERINKAANRNNSDLDFCEFNGRLIINYSWGNQTGEEFLAEAYYDGKMEQFLKGWFPE